MKTRRPRAFEEGAGPRRVALKFRGLVPPLIFWSNGSSAPSHMVHTLSHSQKCRITMDRSQWPLVAFDVPPGDPTEGLGLFFGDVTACFEVGKPFGTVLDLSRASMPCAHARRRMAEFQRENVDLFGHFMLCQGVVCPDPDLVGLITAINWLCKPPMPQQIFERRTEAFHWVASELQKKYPRFVHLSECNGAPSETRMRHR